MSVVVLSLGVALSLSACGSAAKSEPAAAPSPVESLEFDAGMVSGPSAVPTMAPVVVDVASDKSFTFVLKSPPAAVLIKKVLKLDKGSAKPHVDKVGKLTRAQVEEIAKTKIKDLTGADLDAAVRTVAGTARSMGITVEGVI